ncbi:prepilin peptidase [Arthrobacter sp. PAMC25564]|uniref:prepilin peptidase n=1 Tax=Arthrobacter sp. PAMC25564 TaxID=2565366 RepID=UPI0010A29FC0|nr:A24 family peptidase [Arthrobacter sp. PAMC25564]QCB95804.1 prepilin peptidase [Arthrobacter sp. PAMC25564]
MSPSSPGLWPTFISAYAGLFGLLIGSFLNVVVYRVPNGLSIVSPPSACPGCGHVIKAYDNIPVLSWLILRGKCRSCAKPISKRYPLVEAGTGIVFAGVALWAWTGGASARPAEGAPGILVLVGFLYLAAVSVALGLIDIDTHRLPDAIVLPSYLVGVALFTVAAVVSGDYSALLRAGVGMAVLWTAYLLMALAYPGGMGFGDVKLAGLLGLFLGWVGWGPLLVGAFAAFLLGGLFSLALLAARKVNRKSGIPFGPWMLAGAWTGIIGGDSLWKGYLALVGL